MMISDDIIILAKKLQNSAFAHHITIATAESCTAGLLSAALTHHAGSSQVFMAGFLTYANNAKTQMLNVHEDIINQYGAVSQQSCAAMVNGVLQKGLSNFAIAITGVAGPGASDKKPQGLVYIACQHQHHHITIEEYHFYGNRHDVRLQTVQQALSQSLYYIDDNINKTSHQ